MILKERMKFKVSSGLKNIIGRELITSEVVAVFELVKNSYDANATEVIIELNIEKNYLIIRDNGKGMSKEDLNDKWLFVAYSEKKDSKSETGKNYVGAKGIGRFACDRLGSKTVITTKKKNDSFYNILEINWGDFEKNPFDKFENILVNYDRVDKFENIKECGTEVKIINLRDDWDKSKIDKLIFSLEKLINPFITDIEFNINIQVISKDNKLSLLSTNIRNRLLDALKEKTIHISTKFSDKIESHLWDRGQLIYKIDSETNNTGLQGIDMELYYLNFTAKVNFKKIMGIDTVNYGSLLIYKNGFRIYPYGETKYDTFELNLRKTQGYARYLGNRELVGYISIEDKTNKFIEVSSRDGGFIENVYLTMLKDIYMEYVHKPLEKYVNLIKWGYDATLSEEIYINDIKNIKKDDIIPAYIKNDDFNIKISDNLRELLKPTLKSKLEYARTNNISEDELKELVKESHKQITEYEKNLHIQEKNNQQNFEQLKSLENQNTLLKKLTNEDNILQAEITHHISKMADSLSDNAEMLFNELSPNYLNNSLIMKSLSEIKKIASKMLVFSDIILKGDFSAKSSVDVNLYDYFKFYIDSSSNIANVTNKVTIKTWIDEDKTHYSDWEMEIDVYDISVIIDNMVANVWELKGTYLDISFSKINMARAIIFSSNTPKIAQENIQRIFELGFSTKKHGTGIGLFHIKQIIDQNNWKIYAENMHDRVNFIVIVD